MRWTVFSVVCHVAINVFIFAFGFLGYCFYHSTRDFSSLLELPAGKPSVVYDDQGEVLTSFSLDKRDFVGFKQLPSLLVNACIAAEDHSFFSHPGISIKGMIRSFLVNLSRGRVVQGASTITQQIVRLLFLSHDRTLMRKIKEIFLALQLERNLTKEQIFELYVNNIYFGRGIYGVAAASRRFWNKKVDELTIDEAATLAAVAKSARFYSPLNDPENAKKRRNAVLQSMLALRHITSEEYQGATSKEIILQDYVPGDGIHLYVQEWIRNWAEQRWGRDMVYRGGLKIQTTLNQALQKKAEETFRTHMILLRKKYGQEFNGGLVALESKTGNVKAFIGGFDFRQSQFNRAFQAKRQTGSSFKPIVYAAALDVGLSFDMTYDDEPLELAMPNGEVWKPRNWNNKHAGSMTLVKALTESNNIVTIKTLLATGYDCVIHLARKFGIKRNLSPFPSLALGIAEATALENAAAFNVFTNHGYYIEPHVIALVKDEQGSTLWEKKPKREQVLSSALNSKMVNALSIRMQRARKWVASDQWIDAESIGKTGSTNDSMTNWFVGATPDLTTAVYLGRDDNKSIGKEVYANQTSYPIWLDFYRGLKTKQKYFYFDPSLKEVAIHWVTGERTQSSAGDNIVKLLE